MAVFIYCNWIESSLYIVEALQLGGMKILYYFNPYDWAMD